jgi:hypothetical protein
MGESSLVRHFEVDGLNVDVIGFDPGLQAVDVDVHLPGGDTLNGTFVSPAFIAERLRTYESTGENRGGTYFWCSGCVVLRSFVLKDIVDAIVDMWRTGIIEQALRPGTPHGA